MHSDYKNSLRRKSDKQLVAIVYFAGDKFEAKALKDAEVVLLDRNIPDHNLALLQAQVREDIREQKLRTKRRTTPAA